MNLNQIMKHTRQHDFSKRLIFTICLLLSTLSATSLQAQTSTIEIAGKVTDALGDPMPGVSVLEKGTTNGMATDLQGEYRITVKSPSSVLLFSFMGFNSVEETVGNRRTIPVTLEENLTVLDDVVVIGYGTTTKKKITGSVSSLSSDDFKAGNVTDPLQLLQGQIAGLVITRPGGNNPNGDFEIQLRGLTTMSGGAQPLIVIDGVVGGDLSSLSADNIQSFDVLKDGSAAAIYGTRGTNGVILVTTKKAAAGVNKLEFNSYLAVQTLDKKPDMMNADEFRRALDQYGVSAAHDYGASTDWFDEITRTPISQNYSVASSGGSHSLNYRASIAWNRDEGLVKKSSSERLRTRLNVAQLLLQDRLKMDYTVSYSTARNTYADDYIMRQAMFHNPTEPIYATENTPEQYGPYHYVQGMEYYNPVAMLEQRDDKGLRTQFTGSVNANLQILENLKANAVVSTTTTSERYGHYYGKYHPVYIGKDGQAEVYNNHSSYKMLETTVDYSNTWKGHKLQTIVGYSYSEQWNEAYGAMNYLFDTDYFSFYNIGAGGALNDGLATMSSSKQSSKLIAFFGRVMYNYQEKYLLSASVRHEGSSRFGANHKWGTFPSVSVGWRVTQERFMQEARWINDLKVRAGFGVTGNQEIGNYQSLPILRKGSSYFYYNNSWLSTYEPGRNPNPDLRWEKKNEFNVGFDAAFLKNNLNVTFDFYNRTTKDLLYTYAVPVPPNLYGYKFANVGTIVNKGVELTLAATPYSNRNFRWNLVGTIAHNTNKLKSFSNADYAMTALDTGYLPDDLKVYTMQIVEGGSIGNFWGPKFTGFDTDGIAQYEDLDGVEGITEADYQKIGNAYPDFTFSLQNSFVYKNFDLSFLLRGSVGNDVLNKTRLYYEGPGYLGLKNVLNSTFDHQNHPGPIYSSYYIEDGSFLKLDNLTIGYTVPVKSSYISKLRLYVTGQNLFTITGYKGIDPEVSLSGLAPGIENYDFYPRTKTFIFGVNLVF
ncbi:MAG: TonB-dependent receptor [Bacteroides sp.]|nr:TonB-dependent receptor [Bacteroides sp.]